MTHHKLCAVLPITLAAWSGLAQAQLLSIALPERTRLSEDQRLDLVIAPRNLTVGMLRVTANSADISRLFTGPTPVDLDCDTAREAVWRAGMVGFNAAGWVRLEAMLTTPQGTFRDVRDILVQPFPRPAAFKFAGAAWDVIEFDKAVGVGRAWAAARRPRDTLLVATADHGQSMVIIGVADIRDADYFDRTSNLRLSVSSPIGTHSATIYKDVNANVRPLIP